MLNKFSRLHLGRIGAFAETVAFDPPNTNLVARLKAGVGETVVSGRVTAIADQSERGLDASADGAGPYQETDWKGRSLLRFISGETGTMTFGAAHGFNSREVCIFAVLGIRTGQNLIDLVDYAFSSPWLRNFSSSTTRELYTVGIASGIRPEMNPMLFGVESTATKSKVYTNTEESEDLGTHFSDDSINGITIGGLQSNDDTLDVYEVLVYEPSMSAPDIAALKSYVASEYGLRTIAWDKQIVCVGDSNTQGVNTDVILQYADYPRALLELTDDSWKVVNNGASGDKVSNLVTRQTATDSHYDAGKSRNVLVVNSGRNDATTDSGATIYANLVSYIAARVSAGWEVWATTTIATGNGTVNGNIQDLNDLLRGTVGDGIIIDAGAAKLIDWGALPEFDEAADASNTTYYQADVTHLKPAGYAKMAAAVFAEL